MVAALLDRGLVERHRDPSDRRRLVMALTREGRRLLEDLRPQVAAIEARMLVLHSQAEVDELRASLELCREALSPSKDTSADSA
jgi:DNA-binding MarR family transcriptional regulator